MKYRYEVIKSDDVSREYFTMAFYCTAQYIESVFYECEHKVEATLQEPYIFISQYADDQQMIFSLEEMNKKIGGAFKDKKNLYSEFSIVHPSEVDQDDE